MIPKSVLKALNQQIQKELFSAYYYLSMATHFQSANLNGFAHWMRKQYEEETNHAMKIVDFLGERSGRVVLEAIEKPGGEFKTPLDVMKLVLEHEKKVTASINAVYELAVKEKDYPTQIMLEWFIKEQVEEERSAEDVINMLKMIGDAPAGLVMLDRQLASRGS
ncbi:MAG TPA: ferritin [Bacteroidota bacterium]|nr:ferritin [Bacteroidota bacterium]